MKENKGFLNISVGVPTGLTARFPKLTDTFKYHKKSKDIFVFVFKYNQQLRKK